MGYIEAVLAQHRFGMGPRPGSIAAIESDPRGALLAELDKPGAGALAAASLPSATRAFRIVADANAERQAKRIVAARAQKEAERQRVAAAGPTMVETSEQAANEMAAKVAADQGKCFDTAMKEIKLPKYEKWGGYEQYLAGNVERYCEYWGRGY